MRYPLQAPHIRLFCLFSILVFAAWLRFPFIGEKLPYFFDEDEAHHHNRVVNMVKSGNFDPEYFHKPSLHFYLRMPFIALGFLSQADGPEAPRIEKIRTSDSYGIGGYAFTTSSPSLVKWNRLCSFLISLAVIATTFLLVFELYPSVWAASIAALFVTLSPDMLARSATVAVDMPMTLACLLAVLFALRGERRKNIRHILLSAICAGLAISTKYNAFPILLVPLLASFALPSSKRTNAILLSLFLSVASFLLASPYILAHIPLFLNQLAYEKWHYGSAGHEGHSGNPGMSQVLFYLRWLASSALGLFGLCLAFFAFTHKLLRREFRTLVFVGFPLCFFLYMCAQKVNFERNMIVVIPFFSIAAGLGLVFLARHFSARIPQALLICSILALLQPAYLSFVRRAEAKHFLDTREVFAREYEEKGFSKRTALAGELWLRPGLYRLPHAAAFSQKNTRPEELAQLGFSEVLVGNLKDFSIFEEHGELVKEYPGMKGRRVVENPLMRLYGIPENLRSFENLQWLADKEQEHKRILSDSSCTDGLGELLLGEDHCWAQRRLIKLGLSGISSFQAASPWEGQELRVISTSGLQLKAIEFQKAWEWVKIEVPQDTRDVYLLSKILRSPQEFGGSDARVLGVALKP